MFVYCLWSGDMYENTRYLLTYPQRFEEDEFVSLCNQIKTKILKDAKPEDIVADDEVSVFEYSIPSDLLDKVKELLIMEYGFKELRISAVYHENGIDPYEYCDAEKEGKQVLGVNWWG